jgi:branched-chain amino acid aminotransferase
MPKKQRTNYIWVDGEFVPQEQTDIDLLSPQPAGGTLLFEEIHCYETTSGPAVFRLEEHLIQFLEAIRSQGYPVCYSLSELRNTVHGTLFYNGVREGKIRPSLVMNTGESSAAPVWAVAAWAHPQAVEPGHQAGTVGSSIILNEGLPEGAALFIVKKGTIYTPPSERFGNQVLRDSVVTLARDLGYPVVEESVSHEKLYSSEEAFISTAVADLKAVIEVDRHVIGDGKAGKVTRALQSALFETMRGRGRRSQEWLDWVWGSFVGM